MVQIERPRLTSFGQFTTGMLPARGLIVQGSKRRGAISSVHSPAKSARGKDDSVGAFGGTD